MIAPEQPEPTPWPDVLAGYVDGELDGATREAVERWLAAHPQAREELRAQYKLSPENWRLWQKLEPPLPREDRWRAVQEAVARGTEPVAPGQAARDPVRDRRRKPAAGLITPGLAAAAAILLALGIIQQSADRGQREIPGGNPAVDNRLQTPADDPLAGMETLAIARDDEVIIDRVAGDAGEWLPVGEPPLTGPIVLVSIEELELEDAEEHPAWPTSGPVLNRRPGDAPMIFAAAQR